MWWRKKDEVEKLIAKLAFWEPKVVRKKAIRALGTIGDARAVKPLIKLLSPYNDDIHNEAIEALGNIGDARAVDPLIKILEGWNFEIRRAAAEALGKIKDIRAVEPLIEALGDYHPYVCENAAAALVKIGSQAVESLIKALMHENADVRVEVTSILEQIGWTPGNDVERTNFFTAKGSIETVLFGQKKLRWFDENLMLLDPDVSELIIPISKLKWIEIYPETYNFHHVEHFITYAVNYIGQEYLKKRVEVHIYDDPDKLHPNLRNTFKNLCKCVEVHQ